LSGRRPIHAWRAVVSVLRRARAAQRRRDQNRGPLARTFTAAICVVAGLMITMSAINARGTDLRPARNTDLVSLIQFQSRRNTELGRSVTDLRKEVDGLAARADQESDLGPEVDRATRRVGLNPVSGPGVTVTLDDAPPSVAANGIEPDLLVVHQQDIQAVVNAFWAGGAEAMTIQDQRVISTTAVKCVGNTVVFPTARRTRSARSATRRGCRMRWLRPSRFRSISSTWMPTGSSSGRSPSPGSTSRPTKARSTSPTPSCTDASAFELSVVRDS
jgi:uncharacterized protein YlxW (UPF0749 family)